MRILDNIGLVQDPIHLGVVILDKLVNDLKSKLPFLQKKRDEDFDDEDEGNDDDTTTGVEPENTETSELDEDEVVEDKSLIGKITSQFKRFKKSKNADDTDIDAEAPSKTGKKAPSKIIIISSLLIMAVVLLPDLFTEEEATPDPTTLLKPKGKKVKKDISAEPETTPVETAPTETTTAPVETAPTESTTTPVETAPTESTTTETTPVIETAPGETTPTDSIGEEGSSTSTETTSVSGLENFPTEDTSTSTITDGDSPVDVTSTAPDETSTDQIDTGISDTSNTIGDESEGNLTDKILEDLENQAGEAKEKTQITTYIAPPDYEYRGRGLVYNCNGKHWACVDGPSYKSCEDNAAGNKYLGKKPECYPFNVYQTQSGCENMQNRVVSSSAKTEFCKGF